MMIVKITNCTLRLVLTVRLPLKLFTGSAGGPPAVCAQREQDV